MVKSNGQQAEVVKQLVFVNSLRTRDYGLNARNLSFHYKGTIISECSC